VKLIDASQPDVARMFDRLQRGVTTNTAEKLNAILGGMRDFVNAMTRHPFLSKVSITEKRMTHNHICAQITLVALEGQHNLKFKDLEKMYKDHTDFDMAGPEAMKIREVLDYLNKVFLRRTSHVRNRATVVSLFWFVLSEREEFSLIGKERLVREFFEKFQDKLRSQIRLGKDATDVELLSYQTAVIQAADTRESIIQRHNILVKKFREFASSGKR